VTPTTEIQLLPEHIIDQIKAGEVIERPSTLLKEIIENSVDARASKIEIHIIENGLELISLVDNGLGINPQELPLAFCRHATSKINRFEDIYHLDSYGFRGEALASIASISKITCETTHQNETGLIKIEGGEVKLHQEDSANIAKPGTKLFIKDLFFNTPVRMKFIQSKTTEKNQIKKILNSFLLANPKIEFTIKWDHSDKQIFQVHPDSPLEKRINDVLPTKADEKFYQNENTYDGTHFKIFLSQTTSRGNAHKFHFLFINNRYVQDISIHKIILNSAKNIWPEGETGHYIAFLDLPSDEIDVNIHPNKTQIKLFQSPKVYSLVSSTIKQMIPKSEPIYNQSPMQTQPNLGLIGTPEFSHRNFDFTTTNSAQDYFENLHSNQQHQEPPGEVTCEARVLVDLNQYSIIQYNHEYYTLDKQKFYQHHFLSQFNDPKLKEETIPLMVSRPIKLRNQNFNESLEFFNSHGFELDLIEPKTILLRSFPKCFQYFPYLQMLEENLNQNISHKNMKQFNFNFLNGFSLSSSMLTEFLNTYSLAALLEESILSILTESALKCLHEKE
jgi:DNA mismatch repair protein MutL